MGCNQSSNFDNREAGLCVIEVVNCKHLPNLDVGSLTDAYVEICFKDKTDSSSKDSAKLRTNVQWNSLNPVFHSFAAFPLYPYDTDTIEFNVMDADVANRDDKVGKAEVLFTYLSSKIGNEVTLDLKLEKRLKSVDGGVPSITIRLVELERSISPKKIRKEFYVIRHGESVWNESQSGKNIKGMVKQYDHELTMKGIEQAQAFNEKWNSYKTSKSSENTKELKAFLSASAIFASPLTRATQTALLTCQGHPALRNSPLLLLRNLREIKNFGSFDTVGEHMGADIEKNVFSKLSRDLGELAIPDLFDVEINPYDAMDTWWTPLQEKENKERVQLRFTHLWSFLRFGTSAETAILVGHSHFFRHMLREHISPEFRRREPGWTHELDTCKLENAACLRVVVEWDTTLNPMAHPVIQNAELVFGTKLSSNKASTETQNANQGPFSRPSLFSINDGDISEKREHTPQPSHSKRAYITHEAGGDDSDTKMLSF